MFASTSLFISLNSAEFCGSWIYGTDPAVTEPVLDLQSYILIWTSFQLLVTIYIALFVPEGDQDADTKVESDKTVKKGGDGFSQPESPRRRSSSFRKKNKKKRKKTVQVSRSPRHAGGKQVFEFPDPSKSDSELDDSDSEEQETEPDLRQTLSIFYDVACNRNL